MVEALEKQCEKFSVWTSAGSNYTPSKIILPCRTARSDIHDPAVHLDCSSQICCLWIVEWIGRSMTQSVLMLIIHHCSNLWLSVTLSLLRGVTWSKLPTELCPGAGGWDHGPASGNKSQTTGTLKGLFRILLKKDQQGLMGSGRGTSSHFSAGSYLGNPKFPHLLSLVNSFAKQW